MKKLFSMIDELMVAIAFAEEGVVLPANDLSADFDREYEPSSRTA